MKTILLAAVLVIAAISLSYAQSEGFCVPGESHPGGAPFGDCANPSPCGDPC